MDDAADQAWSYGFALKTPFFITTNGERIQVWQAQPFKDHELVLDFERQSVEQHRIALLDVLGRDRVLDYVAHVTPDALPPKQAPSRKLIDRLIGNTPDNLSL